MRRRATADGAEAAQRPPWDVFRALRTAAFYGVLNPLNIFSGNGGTTVAVAPGETLWSSENTRSLKWGVLDDVVMGGASQSYIEAEGSPLEWKGKIITQGGGFAGIRTQAFKPAFDVSRCTGIRLRVRGGDGLRYKLMIRDSYEWNGIAWSYEFDTRTFLPSLDGVVEVSPKFSEFVPTLFAKRVPNKQFDTAQLTALQITLSKFAYDGELNTNFRSGDFSLTLESISTY